MGSIGEQLVLAGASNMTAAACTNPIDVVKCRMQIDGQGELTARRFTSTAHCFRVLVSQEGAASLSAPVAVVVAGPSLAGRALEAILALALRRELPPVAQPLPAALRAQVADAVLRDALDGVRPRRPERARPQAAVRA